MVDVPAHRGAASERERYEENVPPLLADFRRNRHRMRSDELRESVERLRESGLLRTVEDCRKAIFVLGQRHGTKNADQAIAVFCEMQRRKMPIIDKDLRHVLMACRRAGDWPSALQLFEQVRASGTSLNAPEYGALISALGAGSQWSLAVHALQEMADSKIEPSLWAHSAAISACENAGRWLEALTILAEADDLGLDPDVVAFTAAISACEKGQQADLVQDLLADMWQRNLKPNSITYNAVIRSCANHKRWAQALELLGLMEADELPVDVVSFNSAMSACDRAGEWTQALEVLRQMWVKEVRPNINTYITVIQACERAERLDEAQALIAQALPMGLGIKVIRDLAESGQVPPRGAFLAALADCKVRGQWQEFLDLLGQMEASGLEFRGLPALFAADAARTCGSEDVAERLRAISPEERPDSS